jgi:hypothetical protein
MIRFRLDTRINRAALIRRGIGLGLVLVAAGLVYAVAQYVRNLPSLSLIVRPAPSMIEREARARERFVREHSGEEPLNVAIGEAVVRLHQAKPMGKFVLGLGWDDRGNDCSDFVKCCVDEGLGLGARFKRGSPDHLIGDSLRVQYDLAWDRRQSLLPGDIVSVKHSPWYDPYPGACWHVGIIGADGMVYDFVKLKSWKEARYGRNKLAWFVRHAQGPSEVIVRRLLPEYRYRLRELKERL